LGEIFVYVNPSLKEENENPLINRTRKFEDAKKFIEKSSGRAKGKKLQDEVKVVNEILHEVEINGDKAVQKYTELFDSFIPDPLQVSKNEIMKSWENTSSELKDALNLAYKRINNFHEKLTPNNLEIKGEYGEILGRRWTPVKRAGIYIPGGRASYPSTVLMNAIPAKVAGVKEILMVCPAGKDGRINQTVLAAAFLAKVDKVFRVGGAQSIAAMAFGTKSIPQVDVITGPGNIYVTLAKKAVYGKVGIDSLAGPSEVLIIADHTAKPKHIAADMLAQAEHDPLASAILLTTEKRFLDEIPLELENQLRNHPREKICRESLKNWGLLAHANSLNSCIELSDQFAPEHLQLLVEKPNEICQRINNAGAIFLGEWTPEAVGDYIAGPNHTLPTSGTARFSSPLSVETFMKATSIIEFNQRSFEKSSKAIKNLAESESLHSHYESIRIRSKDD